MCFHMLETLADTARPPTHALSPLDSPRKTIATAQNLYHRFHLFFPRKDFGYQVQLSRSPLGKETK